MSDELHDRVTNEVLAVKLDALKEIVQRYMNEADARDSRIGVLERCEAVNQQKWENHSDLHKRERGIFGIVSVIVGSTASAIGVLVKKP